MMLERRIAHGLAWLCLSCGACRASAETGDGEVSFAFGDVTKQAAAEQKPASSKPSKPAAAPAVPLGLNLGAVNYFATALPFVDVFKMADPFQSTNAPGAAKQEWDTNLADKIPRDENGYPLELPATVPGASEPQIVRASVAATVYGGRYVVLYDGDGDLEFPATPLQVVNRAPGRIELEVTAAPSGTLFLAIARSSRADHVRNIRVLLPGYETQYAQQPFHPTFLGRLAGIGAVRFMDWGATNNHPIARWSERTRTTMPQGGTRGVAYETMIDLANRIGADPWFCVPHQADDQYVTELAKLIKTRLDPKRRAYIEYSNELWNGIFEQAQWIKEQGCRAGLQKVGEYAGSCDEDGPRFWAGIKWSARRSGQVFKIFDSVFAGEPQRLTRVLAGQSANEHLNDVLLKSFENPAINPAKNRADVLAIAPYVGGEVASQLADHGQTASATVPQLLERVEKLIGPEVAEPTRKNKQVAAQHGLQLAAYEGGQHLVAYGPAANDEAFVQKLIAANRDPRMRAIYMRMLDAWYTQSDQGLLMLFNFVETPSKYGMWGLLEHQEQSLSDAPKYQAFFDRLQRLQTRSTAPSPTAPRP